MRPVAVIMMSLLLSACASSEVLNAVMLGLATSSVLLSTSDKNNNSDPCDPQTNHNAQTDPYCQNQQPNPFYDEQTDIITITYYEDNDASKPPKEIVYRQTEYGMVRITPEEEPLIVDKTYDEVAKKGTDTKSTTKSTTKKTKKPATTTKSATKKSTTKAPTIKGKVNCSKFANHAAAQAYFEARKHGWKGLDRDSDGIACEHLD